MNQHLLKAVKRFSWYVLVCSGCYSLTYFADSKSIGIGLAALLATLTKIGE